MRSLFVLVFSVLMLNACKIYKFTDASINPNIKTFSIANFPNLAPIQVPSLSPLFIEKLQTKFLRESSLGFVTNDGDISFDGAIVEYSIDPVAITNTETVAQNRLTIGIRIDYVNKLEPEKSFTNTFREQEVYQATLSGADVDNNVAPLVLDKLVQTIFNKAFVNW